MEKLPSGFIPGTFQHFQDERVKQFAHFGLRLGPRWFLFSSMDGGKMLGECKLFVYAICFIFWWWNYPCIFLFVDFVLCFWMKLVCGFISRKKSCWTLWCWSLEGWKVEQTLESYAAPLGKPYLANGQSDPQMHWVSPVLLWLATRGLALRLLRWRTDFVEGSGRENAGWAAETTGKTCDFRAAAPWRSGVPHNSVDLYGSLKRKHKPTSHRSHNCHIWTWCKQGISEPNGLRPRLVLEWSWRMSWRMTQWLRNNIVEDRAFNTRVSRCKILCPRRAFSGAISEAKLDAFAGRDVVKSVEYVDVPDNTRRSPHGTSEKTCVQHSHFYFYSSWTEIQQVKVPYRVETALTIRYALWWWTSKAPFRSFPFGLSLTFWVITRSV